MGVKLITPPATDPVTLDEAKTHLRIAGTDDDTKVSLCIKQATQAAERFLGRALIDQTWELYLDGFPSDGDVKIPKPPLIQVQSVAYYDAGGILTLVDPASYYVDTVSEPGWLVRAGGFVWPVTLDAINSVVIRFRAGYLTADSPPIANVPDDIREAVLLILGTFFEHREMQAVNASGSTSATLLPWGVEQILRQHRVLLGMA